jgi:hypothetical protein
MSNEENGSTVTGNSSSKNASEDLSTAYAFSLLSKYSLSLKSHWLLLLMYLNLNSFLLVSTEGAGIFASNRLKISLFCCCSALSKYLDSNEKASAVLKSSDAFFEDELP